MGDERAVSFIITSVESTPRTTLSATQGGSYLVNLFFYWFFQNDQNTRYKLVLGSYPTSVIATTRCPIWQYECASNHTKRNKDNGQSFSRSRNEAILIEVVFPSDRWKSIYAIYQITHAIYYSSLVYFAYQKCVAVVTSTHIFPCDGLAIFLLIMQTHNYIARMIYFSIC